MNSETSHQRVLVAGSWGQLGSELVRLLGKHAVGLDLPEFDITDRGVVRAAFEVHRPDVVINAAAFTQVDLAEAEPERCRMVNVQGVENLVDACNRFGASIVQISTDYVFDGGQTEPYRESDRVNPLNTYGKTKLEAEELVAGYDRHLIVRTAGLFGVGGVSASRNFVDTMVRLGREGADLRVVSDQVSSFTYAHDLAQGITALVGVGETGLFHLVNPGSASWYEFAAEIFRRMGLSPVIEAVTAAEYGSRAARPRFSVLSTAKYEAVRGHFPMRRWETALSAYVACRFR